MPRTSFGKTRPQNEPYAIYTNPQGWIWKVLKTYKHSAAELKDPHARWFVAATSPMMQGGGFELGDTYASEIRQFGDLFYADPEWREQYG